MFDLSRFTDEDLKKMREAVECLMFYGLGTVEIRQAIKTEQDNRGKVNIPNSI